MKTIFAALAALSFAASASASTNENPFAKDKAVLNLSGIDLSTAEGQQRLAIRMDNAARTVCGERLASVHLVLDEQTRACRTEVVANIRSQIETRQAALASKKVQFASN
ncbi:MAG: UrcA family protein [Sphingobium sp.]